MQTAQMWLVAHLSETATVSRVEVLVGQQNIAYIEGHPRRQLNMGVDVFESFIDAREASLQHYGDRIRQLRYMRETVAEQKDPSCRQQQGQLPSAKQKQIA